MYKCSSSHAMPRGSQKVIPDNYSTRTYTIQLNNERRHVECGLLRVFAIWILSIYSASPTVLSSKTEVFNPNPSSWQRSNRITTRTTVLSVITVRRAERRCGLDSDSGRSKNESTANNIINNIQHRTVTVTIISK